HPGELLRVAVKVVPFTNAGREVMASALAHSSFGGRTSMHAGTVAHVVPSPLKRPPMLRHASSSTLSTHDPSFRQHAPAVAGHNPIEHGVPSPWYVPPLITQSMCVIVEQVPSGAQHAPVGSTTGL